MTEVTVVRLYLSEGQAQLDNLMRRLRDWEKLRGLTVFRGISGFGEDGVIRHEAPVHLKPDLPVVVEFFDTPEKIEAVLRHLQTEIKPGHLVTWTARVNQ
jgi:PII-like signaling protein